MILEHAVLEVVTGQEDQFELAFDEAKEVISSMPGFLSLSLSRCVERPSRYLLLVEWSRLEDHVAGFRASPQYQRWRDLLHHFYDPFPDVDHYQPTVHVPDRQRSSLLPADLSRPNAQSALPHAADSGSTRGAPAAPSARKERGPTGQTPELSSVTERALSFGVDAAAYDAHRPSYPVQLFNELLLLAIDSTPRVVEVGAGTGQATRELAARAASVVALEPDERLAMILRAKNLPNVDVLVTTFERWDESEQRFDIVASAQAWHWVDAEVGVAKAARVLLKDGLLALWWNMPSSDRTTGSRVLDGVYEALAPELLGSSVMVRAKSDGRHTRRVEESPAFDRPYEVEYEWSQEYTADAYVALLATHSDHQAMPSDRRERLLKAVHSEVARMGTIEFRYVTECLIARRL